MDYRNGSVWTDGTVAAGAVFDAQIDGRRRRLGRRNAGEGHLRRQNHLPVKAAEESRRGDAAGAVSDATDAPAAASKFGVQNIVNAELQRRLDFAPGVHLLGRWRRRRRRRRRRSADAQFVFIGT